MSQFQGHHRSRAAFSYSLTAVVPSLFGHLVVVDVDSIRIGNYALSQYLGGFFG